MKKFLASHYELVLTVIAVVFFAILAGYIAWSVTTLGVSLRRVTSLPETEDQGILFDVEGARGLQIGAVSPPEEQVSPNPSPAAPVATSTGSSKKPPQ